MIGQDYLNVIGQAQPQASSGSTQTASGNLEAYTDALKKQGLPDIQVQMAMYERAKQLGMSSGAVDAQMGWGSGVTDRWIAQQGLGSLGSAGSGPIGTPQPLPGVRPAPSQGGFVGGIGQQPQNPYQTPAPAPNPAPAQQPASSFQAYSDALKAMGMSDIDVQMSMYNTAQKLGMTSGAVDSQMGWGTGVTDGWISQQGLSPLGSSQQSPQNPYAPTPGAAIGNMNVGIQGAMPSAPSPGMGGDPTVGMGGGYNFANSASPVNYTDLFQRQNPYFGYATANSGVGLMPKVPNMPQYNAAMQQQFPGQGARQAAEMQNYGNQFNQWDQYRNNTVLNPQTISQIVSDDIAGKVDQRLDGFLGPQEGTVEWMKQNLGD